MRDIAARAAIDPALVIRYFGSKEGLFVRAGDVRPPAARPRATSTRGEIGSALVRHFLGIWEGEGGNGGLPILLRSAASNPLAAEKLREVFAGQVVPALSRPPAARMPPARAGLVAASCSASRSAATC